MRPRSRTRRRPATTMAVALGVAVLVCCGGDSPTGSSGPSRPDFPATVSVPGATCQAGPALPATPLSAIFFVTGFSSRVPNPGLPPPLEARIRVGEQIRIGLQMNGCGGSNGESWTSSNPAVATVTGLPVALPPGFEEGPPSAPYATVAALAPGRFTVFVDFTGADDRRHRTTIGYCSLDAQFPASLGGCADPKLIGTVRVEE